MQDNKFNDYRIPCGMLIVFLEKALTLIHMETHLDDVSTLFHSNSLDLGVIRGWQGWQLYWLDCQKTRWFSPALIEFDF